MLPFTHVGGYTLFPKVCTAAGRWHAIIEVVGGRGTVTQHLVPGAFPSVNAAELAAFVDAAGLAELLRQKER